MLPEADQALAEIGAFIDRCLAGPADP